MSDLVTVREENVISRQLKAAGLDQAGIDAGSTQMQIKMQTL